MVGVILIVCEVAVLGVVLAPRQELLEVEAQGEQSFLDGVRLHVDDVINLLLAETEAQLLEHFQVQRVPVVALLGNGVGLAVVVQIDEFWREMAHDFR